jgi:8-oxo-dGTP pyrophosphatase MutT (NUDIX family)
MGAGILPVTIHNNQIYYLLGKEVSVNKYSDFGGSKEDDETPLQTAVREGYEELSGILGSKYNIEKLIKTNLIYKLTHKHFTSYIVLIDYDNNLPFYFNNQFKFIKKHFPHLIDKNGMFEKSEINWFTLDDIKNNRNKIRGFFQEIIDELLLKHNYIKNNILLRKNRV